MREFPNPPPTDAQVSVMITVHLPDGDTISGNDAISGVQLANLAMAVPGVIGRISEGIAASLAERYPVR